VYVDYNSERKVQNRKEKEEKRQQFYYTKGNNFSKTNREIPKEFEDQIICGDSQEILSKLPDNCIDVVVTSPPYNFGLEYASTADDHHWETYFEKLFGIFSECIRVLKYGGRAIINVQPLFSDYIPTHHIISNFFMNKKMIWKGEILWEKNNYNCKYTAWGSWKSPSNPYLKYTWEFLEIFCKGDLKKVGISENADICADDFKKWTVGKWSIAPERNMKEFDHPAMFPEELVQRALQMFSFEKDIILDPFNGAGTTTSVAKKLNRRYLGIDISDKYCKTAQKRITKTLF
jgi:DNA modification methylase